MVIQSFCINREKHTWARGGGVGGGYTPLRAKILQATQAVARAAPAIYAPVATPPPPQSSEVAHLWGKAFKNCSTLHCLQKL